MKKPDVAAFFHRPTCSVAYVVSDPATQACAIIDPVLDFEACSGRTATRFADALLAHVARERLDVAWVLDTHPHADHFSAAAYLKERTGAPMAIGEKVRGVQELWRELYHLPDLPTDGRQWDRLFADGERFPLGELEVAVLFSPGHTMASITYLVGDAAFVHDTLFMPDFGTARCDFPGGDAHALYRTIRRLLALPDATRVFTGHDYMPDGRDPLWESTIRQQKAENVHLQDGFSEDGFVAMRRKRDACLPLPDLMLAALQINVRGGRLPEPEDDGHSYLKIPLNRFAETGQPL